MLSEFETIVERATGQAADTIEKEIRASTRALLERQFIFADDFQGKRRYDLVRRYKAEFGGLFDTMGYDLVVDEREQWVGILSQDGEGHRRMTVDETIFLVSLRIIYEDKLRQFMVKDGGRCDTFLSEVWSLVEERTGRARPAKGRCSQLVDVFRRNGLIKCLEEHPGGDMLLEIRPVIVRAITTRTTDALERYAKAADNGPEDQEETDEAGGENDA